MENTPSLSRGQVHRALNSFVATITRLLQRATSTLSAARCIENEYRAQLKDLCREVVLAYEEEKAAEMVAAMRQIVRTVRDGLSADSEQAYEVLSIYVILVAIANFYKSPGGEDLPVAQEIFLAVCLARMAALVRQIDAG